MDKYSVIYQGKYITSLNPRFAARQQVSDEKLEALKATHVMRHLIFKQAEKTQDGRKLKVLAKLFDELEFLQQDLWGLPQDATYHRWFELPGCTCPRLDNMDRIGTTAGRIVSVSCKVHGKQR